MLNKALMSGNVPGWVLKAYQGVGVPSAALHYDEDRYWVAGYGWGPWETFHSIVRASTKYVQTSGGIYLPVASGIKARSDQGLLAEQAATNLALWNRDLTNANWTASNATVLKDQVGIDGVANSASSVLATANNATVTAAAITSASASRTQGWFIQRITGSGAISVSQDGGSTFIAVTTKVGAAWYRPSSTDFSGLTQTVTNPQLVIKLGTSGDKIAVDFVDLEAGGSCTSPILTTTGSATRAADAISISSVPFGTSYSGYVDFTIPIVSSGFPSSASNIALAFNSGSGSGTTTEEIEVGFGLKTSTNNLDIRPRSSATYGTVLTSGALVQANTKTAVAFAVIGAGTLTAVVNGGSILTESTTAPAVSQASIGNRTGDRQLNGYVRRAAIWYKTALAGATLQSLTANPQ